MSSPPGWYPDPKPGGQGLRWWDGSRWTAHVAAGTTQPAPAPDTANQQHRQHAYQYQRSLPPQQPPGKPKRIRTAGRRIGRMGWATFVVLVGVIALAVTRGQQIDYVDLKAGRIGFLGTERVRVTKVKESSDDLQRRVEQLEAEARSNTASSGQGQGTDNGNGDTGGTDTSATTDVDLTGDWFGVNGFRYRIEQFGNEVVVSEIHREYGTTGVGNGTFDGDTLSMSFVVADGSSGHAELQLDGADRLRGMFVNNISGARVPAVLTRRG